MVHTIFAEVEGESPRGKRRAASPRRNFSSSSVTRNSTPAGSRSGSPSPLNTPLTEKPPEYGDGVERDREKLPWLKGRFEGKRTLMIIHENPGGGVMDLDLRGEGAVPGLGVYNLRFTSDVVSARRHVRAMRYEAKCNYSGPSVRFYGISSPSRTLRPKLLFTQSRCISSKRLTPRRPAMIARQRPYPVFGHSRSARWARHHIRNSV